MPIHEYECLKCGNRFEELQKFSEAPLKKHNGCGGRVKKLLSAPAIQFKGTGFYITDYARKGNGPAGEGKKEAKEAKEAKADAKTDSKGESKTDTAPKKKDDAKPGAKTTKS